MVSFLVVLIAEADGHSAAFSCQVFGGNRLPVQLIGDGYIHRKSLLVVPLIINIVPFSPKPAYYWDS